MTTANEIHFNDIGTEFKVTLKDGDAAVVDVSTALMMSIVFKAPSGATKEMVAEFDTDGTDGVIKYITEDGDLDELGTWRIQAVIDLPSGTWHSDIEKFKVYANL